MVRSLLILIKKEIKVLQVLRKTIALTIMLVTIPLHLSGAADTESQNQLSIDELLAKSQVVEDEKFDAEIYEAMAQGLDVETYFYVHADEITNIAELCTSIRENRTKMEKFEKGGILDIKDFVTTQQQLIERPVTLQGTLVRLSNLRTMLPEKYDRLIASYPGIERELFEGILAKVGDSSLFLDAIGAQLHLLWSHRWKQQDFQKELLENINQRKGSDLNKVLLESIETENKLMDYRLGKMGHLMSLYAFIMKGDKTTKEVSNVSNHFRELQNIHDRIVTYPNQGFPSANKSVDQSKTLSIIDIKRELEGKNRSMASNVHRHVEDMSKIQEICPGMTYLPVFARGLQDIFKSKQSRENYVDYFWMNNFLPYDAARESYRILFVNDKGVFLDFKDSRRYR